MKEKTLYNYNRRNYSITAYNTNWTKLFEEESRKIKNIFNDINIEHVGSTSIVGMFGKPCIDFLVIIDSILNVKGDQILEMEEIGYSFAGEFVMKGALLFRKMKDGAVLSNVHFFPENHPHINDMLAVRNYLRNHKEEVEAYSNLKKNLYSKYPEDYANYRKEKDLYMTELVERALKEYGTN